MFIKLDHAFLLPLKGGYKFSPRLTTNYHALPRGKPLKLLKYQTISIMTSPKWLFWKFFRQKTTEKWSRELKNGKFFLRNFFFRNFSLKFFENSTFLKILTEKTFKITISTRKTKAMKSIKNLLFGHLVSSLFQELFSWYKN